jgi:hypothetical protein
MANNAYNDTGSSYRYVASSLGATQYRQAFGVHQWYNAPSGTAGNAITFTQAMTLGANGNLLVGTTTDEGERTRFESTSAAQLSLVYTGIGKFVFKVDSSRNLSILDGTNERARIDSSGNLLVGTTSAVASERLNVTGSLANNLVRFTNSNAAPYGLDIKYSVATPNGTSNEFGIFSDATATRFTFRSNGGLVNYSANNVNLSDRREKTNFAPAGSYLDKICAIPVQTFNYIDQNMEDDGGLTLGVVAQDVQAVAPELIHESNWGSDEAPKMRLSIYQTDLQYALMKCIQEQQAIIESLKARLDAANL